MTYTEGLSPEQAKNVREREQRFEDAEKTLVRLSRSVARGELPLVFAGHEMRIGEASGLYLFDERRRGLFEAMDFRIQRGEARSGMVDAAHAVPVIEMHADGSPVLEVAAKHSASGSRSLSDRVERAQKEVAVSKDMIDRGLPAFAPLAVAVTPLRGHESEGDVILFTQFEPGMFSLDNHPWGRGLTSENGVLARKAMRALGDFNVLGYRHNDAKIKNAAQVEQAAVGMIDFETVTHIDPNNPAEVMDTVHEDCVKMISSLSKRGYFNGLGQQGALDDLNQAYASAWEHSSPAVQHVVTAQLPETLGPIA